MRNKVLSCIYPFVQEYSDSPFSPQIIASISRCDDIRVIERVFKELKVQGLIARKHRFTSVYRVTDEGLAAAREAFELSEKQTQEDSK